MSIKRVLSGLGSLLLLAVVVVGGFVGLVHWGQVRLPVGMNWSTLLTLPDDGSLLVVVLSLIGWAAWLAVVASIVAEVLNRLPATARHIHLPGLGWLQPAIGVLVAAVMGLTIAVAHPAASAPGAVPGGTPVAASAAAVPQTRQPPTAAPTTGEPGGARDASAAVTASQTRQYRVQPGDDLWTLAEQTYGDGAQWRQIVAANPGLNVEHPLEVGTTLRLPVPTEIAAPAAPQLASQPQHAPASPAQPKPQEVGPRTPTTVVVRAGDTLSGLALTHLGDANRWPEIYAANRDQILDPDLIRVGWTLRLPGSHVVEPTPPSVSASPESSAPPAAAPSAPPASPTDGASASATGMPTPAIELPPTTPTSAPISAAVPNSASAPPGEPTVTNSSDAEARPAPIAAPVRMITGGLCGVSALAIITGLAVRRRVQLSQRPPGRALPVPTAQAVAFRTAAGRVADARPEPTAQLPIEAGAPLPLHREPGPLEVVVGQHESDPVLVDLAQRRLLSITPESESPEAEGWVGDLMAGIATGVTTSPWSHRVQVVVAGLDWLTPLDDVRVRAATTETAIELVRAEVLARRAAVAEMETRDPKPDASEPEWDPWVVLLTADLPADQRDVVIAACEAGVGITAVVRDHHPVPWIAGGESITITSEHGAHLSTGERFVPQLISEPGQRALADLYANATSEQTLPAPWWGATDPPLSVLNPQPVQIREEDPMLVTDPVLQVLGPVSLIGARGPLPPRAVKQCEEYCAWLLLHPGSTSHQMAQSLMVAETTRRSNMSRLRTWLGADDDGRAYLPEAFTGRISLAPMVSSDWERLQAMVGAGVNHAGDQTLADALALVQGAPLADAAPGQWAWAEEWRIEMTSVVRDLAIELTDRALKSGDVDLARWAAGRGLSTSPGDELLLGRRIRTEHLAGNAPEVERLVLALTRHARMVGIDLLDETVVMLQEVMEGRARQRA